MENNRPLGWTTLDEAKRLVEAGLDPNTADMYYEPNDDGGYCIYPHSQCNSYKNYDEYKEQWSDIEIIPCWSAGALIGLLPGEIRKDKTTHPLIILKENEGYCVEYNANVMPLIGFCMPSLTDALATMYIWLSQNGFIKK